MKPALEKDIGGTLTYPVPEAGEVTNAKGTLYDAKGDLLAAEATATILTDPSRLTMVITSEQAAALGENYRMLWTYAVGGTDKRKHQLFDVVRAVVEAPLTTKEQLFKRHPIFEGRDFPGVHINDLGQSSWTDLCDLIIAKGRNPNLLIDATPLTAAHAALWASNVARNFQPGNGQAGGKWQQTAAELWDKAHELLDEVFSNLAWYDASKDLKPSDDEVNTNQRTIWISR